MLATKLRKHWLLVIASIIGTLNAYCQNTVIVLGKVNNPTARIVNVEYKKNLFSMEDGHFEARLDENNTFAFKVGIDEPRSIYLRYNNVLTKIFLVPNDTVRILFDGTDMLSSLEFESGLVALPNKYLAKAIKQFPDLTNEKIVENYRQNKTPREYQLVIDSLYFEKRRFIEEYPAEDKDYFSSEFLDYANSDITYWRTYQLMAYYKQFGLNNPDNRRFLDDNYFNFLFDTDNVFYKGLNNEYYLKFLELYLTYRREVETSNKASAMDFVEEKSRSYEVAIPTANEALVLEDPVASKNILSRLYKGDEAIYQNVIISDKVTFRGQDTTFTDAFLKVKLNDGREGWIARSSVQLTPRTSVEKKIWTRQCINLNDALCGFEPLLHSKVLYFAAARDVLLSFIDAPYELMKARLDSYRSKNTSYPEYNEILGQAFDKAIQDRDKRIVRLNIKPSCVVDEYKKDNKTSNNLNRALAVVTPKAVEPPKSDRVQNEQTAIEATKIEKQAEITPTKPQAEIAKPPVNNTEPKKTESALTIISTTVENTESPTQKETTDNKNTASTNVDAPKRSFSEIDRINQQLNKNKPQVDEKPKETAEKPTEKIEASKPPIEKPQTNTAPARSVQFVSNNNKIEFDNTQEIVAIPDMPDYKADGTALIFRGLVLNEDVPAFKIVDMYGKEVNQQELLGKIVFLEFWASWCGPCQAQLTHTQMLQEKYKDKNVVFLYISMDQDQEAWRFAVKEKGLTGIQANDPTIVPINFMVQALPNYFIIGKNGKIALNSIIKSKIDAEKMLDYLLKSQ